MTTLTSVTNGRAAAALVSSAIGCFAIGVFTILASASPGFKSLATLYNPAGPLSGKTGFAIIIWLISWGVLHVLWRDKDVAWGRAMVAVAILVAGGLLLTFPPIFELFEG